MNRIVLLLILMGCLFAVNGQDTIQRPVTPWVFSGALDEEAGRVVVALHENLWLVYDTANCTMYRAWKGSAFVNSSDDSTQLKDQIIVQGFPFVEGEGKQAAWKVSGRGKPYTPQVKYIGHEIDGNDKLTFTYHLILTDGHTITVKESPEIKLPKKPNTNRVVFKRDYTLLFVPDKVNVSLYMEYESIYRLGDIKTDGKLKLSEKRKRMFDWGNLFNLKGDLYLNTDKPTNLTTIFTIDGEAQSKVAN